MKFGFITGILDNLPSGISSKLVRSALITKKHSPSLLFGGGVAGVVGTVVLACKATLQIENVLEEAKTRVDKLEVSHKNAGISDRQYKRESALIRGGLAMDLAKMYAPAIALGATSIVALTGSHVILTKRNTGLMAAYAAVSKGIDEYRQRVRDELGEDKDREFLMGCDIKEIVEEGPNGPEIKYVKRADRDVFSPYAVWFDETRPSWSKNLDYNVTFLHSQQAYWNDKLKRRGHVFLNEVYDALGFPHTKAGAQVGWILGNGDDCIDFGVFDKKDPLTIDFIRGWEGAVRIDFNVDGVILDLIGRTES